MKKLSIRHREGRAYEYGPSGHGPTIVVAAQNRREALHKAKAIAKEKGIIQDMAALTYRL